MFISIYTKQHNVKTTTMLGIGMTGLIIVLINRKVLIIDCFIVQNHDVSAFS